MTPAIVKREHTRGQALPEMLIAFPLVVILVMASIQIALLYRGKATLNNATFLAARSGSLHHGYLPPMEKAFWARMVALGHIAPAARSRNTSAGLYSDPNSARLLASTVALEQSHIYPPLEIIWPTKSVFDYFAVAVRDLEPCAGAGCPFYEYGGGFKPAQKSVYEIPVDNLDARNKELHVIDGDKVTLSDANLLSVRSRYCYDMEVPVANFIIWRALSVLNGSSPDWQVCQALRASFGGDRYFIPVVGHSLVRMQTGLRCQGDEEEGRDCRNI